MAKKAISSVEEIQGGPSERGPWIDDVGGVRFMQELINFYGHVHAARFLGWCVLIGATLREGEKPTAAADRLVSLGFARSGAYKAISEIKEFQRHLIKDVLGGELIAIEQVVANVKAGGLAIGMDNSTGMDNGG